MALNQQLVNISTRHQVFLMRLTGGEIRKFEPFLSELRENILSRLISSNLTDFNRERMEAFLGLINDLQEGIYNRYISQLDSSLMDIGASEADFELRALDRVTLSEFEFVLPASTQIETAIRLRPLSVGRDGAGKLLESFIDGWKQSSIDLVNGIIRQGWFEGQTVAQMASAIGGRDGVINTRIRRANEAIVRTAINHASNMARTITWEANKGIVKGWRFVAVLDSRTTIECSSIASLDRVYPIGRGPIPPRHPGCRSTAIPELDDRFNLDRSTGLQASKGADGGAQVSADMSYYDWLKNQPREFVEDAIGKTRADLLLSNRLTAKQFADFQLNRRFEPLTLEEMIAKDKRLNLGLADILTGGGNG